MTATNLFLLPLINGDLFLCYNQIIIWKQRVVKIELKKWEENEDHDKKVMKMSKKPLFKEK